MPSDSRPVFAIFAVFFLESAVLGNWIPRIPDAKAMLALSDGTLGLCLLAIPAGTVAGLLVAARIIEQTGLRLACQIFLPLWALLFVLPAFTASAMQLGVALFLCGTAVGLVEVAMNTEADHLETQVGKRIMSRCHGFWSLGSMAGALLGSAIAHFGIDVRMHFSLMMPVLAVAGWYAAAQLPTSPRAAALTEAEPAKLFRLPSRAILLLCVMPLGTMAVEGAFIDWSAVFMRSVLEASPLVIGITYAFFSGVMACMRLAGDAIAGRYGDLVVVRFSGIAAALGIGVFSLAPTAPVAFVGAVLSGVGVAIVYPLSVSAAARRPGRSAADNVAALTMVSFTAFLLAPPLIGFLSETVGLRWALLLLSPAAMTTVMLSREVVVDGPARGSHFP